MSGDVQPRKRKDKKKKRDDESSSHGVHITKMGSDDVHLHVQHEHGTGGHWCAKIFFFSLLAILVGLVALIIMENRGLSDLDTPLSESRFSNYFDGWVEEHRAEHDDHDDPVKASIDAHDEHDEPFEEQEDHSEDDDDGDDEEQEPSEETLADDDDEQTKEDDEENNEDDDDDENTTKEATIEQTNEEDDDDDADADADDNDDDVENLTKETVRGETVEEDDDDGDNDDDNETNEKNTEASREDVYEDDDKNNSNNDDNDNDDDDDDDDDIEEPIKPIYSRSTQQTGRSQQSNTNNNDDDDDDDDPFDEEDDDGTFESLENVVENDAEEMLLLQEKARQQAAAAAKNDPPSAENEEDDDDAAEAAPSWISSLAVKIGVGVALALVARLVLIRNNPNTNEEPSPEVVMKRRLTIATEEENFPDDEETPPLPEDEYSDEEIEIEEEIEYEEEIEMPEDDNEDLDMPNAGKYVPETFEQLNAMYRSKGIDINTKPTQPTERVEEISDDILYRKSPKKSPAVFTAPPPPPKEEPIKVQYTPTTLAASTTAQAFKSTPTPTPSSIPTQPSKQSEPSATTTEQQPKTTTSTGALAKSATTKQYIPDSPKPAKHLVSYDVDHHPDDEDIDYDEDDEQYDGDDLDEEDDDDEGDTDDDLLDDDNEISDVDDTELMNRLEAKYGRLPAKEYESDEDPDDPTWTQIKPKKEKSGGPKTQNDELDSFEQELRRANEELMREHYTTAAKMFGQLAQANPDKPQAFLGKAKALDQLAERQRSNKLLNDALEAYKRYLAFDISDIKDDVEYRTAAERCIERMRFIGHFMQSIPIHEQLIERFGAEPGLRNELAVTHLLQNRLSEAKQVLQEVLRRWPLDGFAQVHYGFVLRQLDRDYENAVIYLRHGINSKVPGTQDGRFFFNLGDSLQRLGRQAEAVEVYKRGAALKLFPSVYQRSLYNEPNLRAQPFWRKQDTTYAAYLNKLESNWQAIRDEALSVLHRRGFFLDEAESLRDTGNWQQFELFARGQRIQRNCQKAPITCGLIEEFRAASGCRRGQVKFSVMQPGTHVHAHCGPTNCRLRAHLGLIVPPKGTHLRVAEEERTWEEGKFLIFDDSFEHEVWHNGSSFRMVLIVDVWHPDLSVKQRQTLSPI